MEPAGPPKIHRVDVQWHAVTYKTVIIYGLLVALIVLAGMFIVFPSMYSAGTREISTAIASNDAENAPNLQTQAKFVNLDGKVEGEKVKSVPWGDAEYPAALAQGDLVATG